MTNEQTGQSLNIEFVITALTEKELVLKEVKSQKSERYIRVGGNPPAEEDLTAGKRPDKVPPGTKAPMTLEGVLGSLSKRGLLQPGLDFATVVKATSEMAALGCPRVAIPIKLGGKELDSVPDWKIGYATNHAIMDTRAQRYIRNIYVKRECWPIFRRSPKVTLQEVNAALGNPQKINKVQGASIADMNTRRVIKVGSSYHRRDYGPVTILTKESGGDELLVELQIALRSLPNYRSALGEGISGRWIFSPEKSTIRSAASPIKQCLLTLQPDGTGELVWSGGKLGDMTEGKVACSWKPADQPFPGFTVRYAGREERRGKLNYAGIGNFALSLLPVDSQLVWFAGEDDILTLIRH